jgi:hypothetical protein
MKEIQTGIIAELWTKANYMGETHNVPVPDGVIGSTRPTADQKVYAVEQNLTLTNGTPLCTTIETISLYRVAVPGGYGVFISVAMQFTPHGWMTNAMVANPPCGLHMVVEFLNADGAKFFTYPMAPQTIECTPPVQIPLNWTVQLNQDIYPLVLNGGILAQGGYSWYTCDL